ncbi:MAG: hypothetical protein QOF34_1330 [Sphingomonadales bacterium]|nr:hypothetical protein [Sphingomonadales bacterium]
MKQVQTSQLLGGALVLAVTCWFLLVIAYKWVMLALPSSGFVPFFVAGLTVVGGVLGFIVCACANLLLRVGPSKLRVPLSALLWLAFAGLSAKLLLNSGGDAHRIFIAAAITVPSGLLIGPYWGETIVGAWFLNRLVRHQSSSS